MDQITKKYWKIGILEELVTVLRLNARHIFGQGRAKPRSQRKSKAGGANGKPTASE